MVLSRLIMDIEKGVQGETEARDRRREFWRVPSQDRLYSLQIILVLFRLAMDSLLTTVHVGSFADVGGVSLDPFPVRVHTVTPDQHREEGDGELVVFD